MGYGVHGILAACLVLDARDQCMSISHSQRTAGDTFMFHPPNFIRTRRNVLHPSGEAAKHEPANGYESSRDRARDGRTN